MAVKLQIRRGLASVWATSNPVLAEGEIAWASDTNQLKVGDGTKHWLDLTAVSGTTGPGVAAGGTAGQLLARGSGPDYTTGWIDNPIVLVGGIPTTGSLTATGQLSVKTTSLTSPGLVVAPVGSTISIAGATGDYTKSATTDTITLSSVAGLYPGLMITTSGFSDPHFNSPTQRSIQSVNIQTNKIIVPTSDVDPTANHNGATNGTVTFTGTQQNLQEWQQQGNTLASIDASGNFTTTYINATGNINAANITITSTATASNLSVTNTITAASYAGIGSGLTNLNGANITANTVSLTSGGAVTGVLPIANGGTGTSATPTGTGSFVRASSPTLTTPTLDSFPVVNTNFRVNGKPFVFQSGGTSFEASGTLNTNNLLNYIITSTAGTTISAVLPAATTLRDDVKTALNISLTPSVALPFVAFDWTVINTGSTNTFTVTAGTNHTLTGNGAIPPNSSGTFRTAYSSDVSPYAFKTYRL